MHMIHMISKYMYQTNWKTLYNSVSISIIADKKYILQKQYIKDVQGEIMTRETGQYNMCVSIGFDI